MRKTIILSLASAMLLLTMPTFAETDPETVEPSTVTSITLAQEGETGVSWIADGSSPMGYKVVWSMNPEPMYPTEEGDKYLYVDNVDTMSAELTGFDGAGTYYVRVCDYIGGGCSVYSNELMIELEAKIVDETPAESTVNSITLTPGDDGSVSWMIEGEATKGFKVVYSKTSEPTYPNRPTDTYRYVPNSHDRTSSSLTGFDGAGTYYVRVCEYLGADTCGTYSNEVIIELPEPSVSQVNSIALNPGVDNSISWVTDGDSEKGFKIVWSQYDELSYPPNLEIDQVKYVADSNVSSITLEAFDGDGTYYVVVCEYLGDKCGVYSNEAMIELTGKVATDTFKDVDTKSEYYDAILYLKKKDVVSGYNNEGVYFGPKDKITRAAFLKIVFELSDHQPSGSHCFDDVKDEWFSGYICEAKKQGFVEGYTPDTFGPERDINFVEATKIIANVLELKVDENYNEIWYEKYVRAMDQLAAVPEGVKGFNDIVTREIMAEMAYRVDAEKTDKASATYDGLKSKVQADVVAITTITLKDAGSGKVEWSVDGHSAKGFKVVYSLTPGPTYPTRDSDEYQYFSDPNTSSAQLKAFDGSGTYYVRVCEYLGGACGVYSNEVMVNL